MSTLGSVYHSILQMLLYLSFSLTLAREVRCGHKLPVMPVQTSQLLKLRQDHLLMFSHLGVIQSLLGEDLSSISCLSFIHSSVMGAPSSGRSI